MSACCSLESRRRKISSHGAFVITPGSDENTSPDAMLSLTRTACHLEAFSVISNSSLIEKNEMGKECVTQ